MRRRSPEHDLQVWVIGILAYEHSPGVLWYAIPNGGYRIRREGARLKAEGLRAGAADIALVINGQAAFLELKATKGRLSEAQKAFQADCKAAGAWYAVANSHNAAIEILYDWKAIPLSSVYLA